MHLSRLMLIFFKDFVHLLMKDTQREAETQAERKAGSTQGAQYVTRSQNSSITPRPEGRRPIAEQPRHPIKADTFLFCLDDVFIDVSCILKSSTILVFISICPFIYVYYSLYNVYITWISSEFALSFGWNRLFLNLISLSGVV